MFFKIFPTFSIFPDGTGYTTIHIIVVLDIL